MTLELLAQVGSCHAWISGRANSLRSSHRQTPMRPAEHAATAVATSTPSRTRRNPKVPRVYRGSGHKGRGDTIGGETRRAGPGVGVERMRAFSLSQTSTPCDLRQRRS